MNRPIATAALALAPAMLLPSCTKHVYVPVENTRVEYRELHSIDTIALRDSVSLSEHRRGDTLVLERDRWRTIYRVRIRRDTIARTDTVTVPVPVAAPAKPSRRLPKSVLVLAILAALALLAALLRPKR